MGLPRVVTVDPTGAAARIVRAALDFADRTVIQIDLPGDALDEIRGTGCDLLITALHAEGDLKGIDLALQVKQMYPKAGVVVLGDRDDPDELDPDYRATAPFVYLHRPLDGGQFLRILNTALDGGDILAAAAVTPTVSRAESPAADLGPIPPLDMKVTARVVDSLLIDVGAMAIVVSNRSGDVLLERGAVGYLDREVLTGALVPAVKTTIDMGQLVGGSQPSALYFYDGDRYDVFVLSIGFHHFMCLVFDGQIGIRQFGAVNRFGRRSAEDLIALLGTSAFALAPQQPPPEVKLFEPPPVDLPVEPPIIRAEAWTPAPAPQPVAPTPLPEL
jgi:DNA-binding NarL/FixJ family response regulator